MATPRIYTEQPLYLDQPSVVLNEAASHHLCKVMRLTCGAKLTLFNGLGGEYSATLNRTGKKAEISLEGFDPIDRESPLSIHLAIGISRSDRMDTVIQKATELGVTRITPLVSERVQGNRKPSQLIKKTERWQSVMLSACEQSGRTRLAIIHAPIRFSEWLCDEPCGEKIFLQPSAQSIDSAFRSATPSSITIAIGPEGGWAPNEQVELEQRGFSGVGLGPRILRTETAPLAILALCQARWGDI